MFAATADVADFVRDHGGDPVSIGHGELLLPDGARVILNGPIYRDPPAEPRRQMQAKLTYAQTRCKDAMDAERLFHSSCVGHAEFRWDAAKLGSAPEAWQRMLSGRRDIAAEEEVKRVLASLVLGRKCAVDSAKEELFQLALPM